MKCGIFILTVLFLHSFQVSDGGRFGKKCSGHGPHHSPPSNHIPPHLPSHQGTHHGPHPPSHPGHHGTHHEPAPSDPSGNELGESGSGQSSSSNEDPNSPPWNEIQYCDKPSSGLNCFGCFGGGSSKKKHKKPKRPKNHSRGPRCSQCLWTPKAPSDWDLPSANEVV